MWDKPRELTPFVGTGYEIVAWYSAGIDAYTALSSWKSSPPHNNVILNQGVWNNYPWSSIGIGIYGIWAAVWFAEEIDPCGYFGETDWTLTINGPTQVTENSGAQYSCTADYNDGSTSDCTSSASWSVNCSGGGISGSGYLTTSSVSSDQICMITASFKGKSDTHSIMIKNVPTCYTYDFDCDGDVDIVDVMMVASRWNTNTGDPGYDAQYDLDGDGDIDIVDVMMVAAQWG
jgi:hypothetical protein